MSIDQKAIDERLKTRMADRKKEMDDRKNKKGSYQIEERIPLEEGKDTLVRIVDIPTPVYYSFIKCDDDKTRLIKFPRKEDNGDFIIYQIADVVFDREYIGKDAKGKAKFNYPIQEKYPEIFNLVYNNGLSQIGQYGANGWIRDYGRPQEAYYINVINRQPFSVIKTNEKDEEHEVFYEKDWCVKNKHSLLLVKSMKSIGVPVTVNNVLMDSLFPNFGNFTGYDVLLTRLGDKPWYEGYKAETLTEKRKKYDKDLVEGPLSNEECQIELYDTKTISKPSSATYVYKNLKNKIALIDKTLGTNFLEKLMAQVESEGGEMSEDESSEPEEEESSTPEVKKEEPKEEKPVVRSRVKASSTDGLDEAKILEIAPHLKGFKTEDLKALIKGVEGDKIVWISNDLADCPKCGKLQPFSMDVSCLYCGTKF